MKRKLFCEISPLTYKISLYKLIFARCIKNQFGFNSFAAVKNDDLLPNLICKHNSLIRRRLGNCDLQLQENKAVNLSLTVPKINKVIIKPKETFSFWQLVGNCTKNKGYKEGLTISRGVPSKGIGGGMCQLTNLIHWMILHTSMEIVEHHHHDQLDLFPDFKRQIPFGTGTSIMYNYIDYRFFNNTDRTYQLIVSVCDEYLCGEIRADKEQKYKYHIESRNEFYSRENDGIYRNGEIFRRTVDKQTGKIVKEELIRKNHAKVVYDTTNIDTVDMTN